MPGDRQITVSAHQRKWVSSTLFFLSPAINLPFKNNINRYLEVVLTSCLRTGRDYKYNLIFFCVLVLLEKGWGRQAGRGTGCSFQSRFSLLNSSSLQLEALFCFKAVNQAKPFDSLRWQNLSRGRAEEEAFPYSPTDEKQKAKQQKQCTVHVQEPFPKETSEL